MSITNEKTTIYLDPRVKRGAQLYALRDKRSLSDIINQKLIEFLEDMADAAEIDKRKHEPTTPFDQVAAELGIPLDEIRNQAQKERTKRTR